MTRSDFAWVNFDEEFNGVNTEATRSFRIDGDPIEANRPGQGIAAEGFILIQAEHVGTGATAEGDRMRHRILINGQSLPAFDMIDHQGWNLWMDRIPPGVLKKGDNRLTVRRIDRDNFRVANVMVQWREKGAVGGGGVVGADDITVEA